MSQVVLIQLSKSLQYLRDRKLEERINVRLDIFKKKIPLIIALISAFLCVFLLYRIFDLEVTLAYMNDDYSVQTDKLVWAKKILESEWKGLTEKDVLVRLKNAATDKNREDYFRKVENEAVLIHFDNLSFKFREDRLEQIE
jgi:hypothetical protein